MSEALEIWRGTGMTWRALSSPTPLPAPPPPTCNCRHCREGVPQRVPRRRHLVYDQQRPGDPHEQCVLRQVGREEGEPPPALRTTARGRHV